MVGSETDHTAAAATPLLERRNLRRRAVWYSILGLLVVAGLTLPFLDR